MTKKEILAIFEKTGAMLTGHFVLTSGAHSDSYFNKDAITAYPRYLMILAREIARQLEGFPIEVVVSPAIGAAILGNRVAGVLSELRNEEVLGVYAEKVLDPKGFILKRGFDKFIPGRSVAVVEDILTTGGSAKRVVESVRELGGKVEIVSVLANRGGVTAEDLGVEKLFSLVLLKEMKKYPADDCPLCRENGTESVRTDVGKGGLFLKNLREKAG